MSERYSDQSKWISPSSLSFAVKRLNLTISIDASSERLALEGESTYQGLPIEYLAKSGSLSAFPTVWRLTIGIGAAMSDGTTEALFLGSLGPESYISGYCMFLLTSKEMFEKISTMAREGTGIQLSVVTPDIGVCGDGSVLRWNETSRQVLRVSSFSIKF